jgi:hypothetical protein
MIIHLVPEGHMEEPTGRRLIAFCGHSLGTIYNSRRGCGYIRSRAALYHSLATSHSGVLVLTDFRDAGAPCPVAALDAYLLHKIPHPAPSFIFRFAVNELESWLMADRSGLAQFLGVPVTRLPKEPEAEEKPKRTLVAIARHSSKTRIRDGLAPPPGSQASVGPLYRAMMSVFIEQRWNIEAATANAPSLERCVRRLTALRDADGVL